MESQSDLQGTHRSPDRVTIAIQAGTRQDGHRLYNFTLRTPSVCRHSSPTIHPLPAITWSASCRESERPQKPQGICFNQERIHPGASPS